MTKDSYSGSLHPQKFVDFLNARFGNALRENENVSVEAAYELRNRLWFPGSRKKIVINKRLSPTNPDYFGNNILRVANLNYIRREDSDCEDSNYSGFYESLLVKFLNIQEKELMGEISPQTFEIVFPAYEYNEPKFYNHSGTRQFTFDGGWIFNPNGFN